jgi:hypothetical protein
VRLSTQAARRRDDEAIDRLDRLSADATDQQIAEAMAEHLIAMCPYSRGKARGVMHLSIFHDVRRQRPYRPDRFTLGTKRRKPRCG